MTKMIDHLIDSLRRMPRFEKRLLLCHPDNVLWLEDSLRKVIRDLNGSGYPLVTVENTFDIKPNELCPRVTPEGHPAVYMIEPPAQKFIGLDEAVEEFMKSRH